MDNKWLVIQSFQRNQELVDDISKLLIYYKLLDSGVDNRLSNEEIQSAKNSIREFLKRLSEIVPKLENKDMEPLFGVDHRLKHLAQSFVEAKGKRNKFKSDLFKKNLNDVLPLLDSKKIEEIDSVILSLSELRSLLEDQISIDSKEIISDF